MKIQISFDHVDINRAITIARQVESFADIFEIGSVLIYKYGVEAVKKFSQTFEEKTILADTKIIDRSKDSIAVFSDSGAHWLTVMAGAGKDIIHNATTIAHMQGKKIMLDLLDASSLGQSALEAQTLGVDALMIHQPYVELQQFEFAESWEMVRGNTKLPIYCAVHITRKNIHQIVAMRPDGIIIGNAITQAENPEEEARYFYEIISGS
jgi:3-hexulose-6-phosphate synthase